MRSLKNERGAITLITLVTVLFFMAFLIGSYIIANNQAGSQIQMTEQIRSLYYPGNIEALYNSYFEGSVVLIYRPEEFAQIGSGRRIAVEVGDDDYRYFIFSVNAMYILMENFDVPVSVRDNIRNRIGDERIWWKFAF